MLGFLPLLSSYYFSWDFSYFYGFLSYFLATSFFLSSFFYFFFYFLASTAYYYSPSLECSRVTGPSLALLTTIIVWN